MKRRRLLVSALGAGALLVGWTLLPPRSRIGGRSALAARGGRVALNGWIRIGGDGLVHLVMPRSEMGQGVHTALAMIVAEELDVPLAMVQLEDAGGDSRYGNVAAAVDVLLHFGPDETEPGAESRRVRTSRWLLAKTIREIAVNATGGSSSIADLQPVLRLAAATARAQLLGAASLEWRLPVAELQVHDGVVSHPSGPQAHYGRLAAHAATTPPGNVRAKPPGARTLVGRAPPRIDLPAKVDGSARFGIDVREPGQLYAAVAFAPQLGGSPGALDADAALRLPGVLRVVRLPPYAGAPAAIAVVARTSWHAIEAARALPVQWRPPPRPVPDSAQIARALDDAAVRACAGERGFVFRSDGDALAGLAKAGRVVEARYRVPYLAHAALEPVNCTAAVAGGRVRVWAPTQAPTLARRLAARVAGVAEDDVDVVGQAVRVALETGGAPVQLLWPREEDMRHDYYRPAAAAVLRAALGDDGRPLAIAAGTAGDAVLARYGERVQPPFADLVARWPDRTSAEGLFDLPYRCAALRVAHEATRHGVPVGPWRSVGHSQNAFFAESFVDELAHAAGADPLQYRLALLDGRPRHAAVLRLAGERAGWGGTLPAGRARGVALHTGHDSVVALVVEVARGADGAPRVHRVVAAIDCGSVVHRGIVAQQVESGIVFGLAAALYGRIDVEGGAVRQSNFTDVRLPTLAETPQVHTHIVDSDRAPGGAGELTTPPLAPALANAWFALTGERRRELPFVR